MTASPTLVLCLGNDIRRDDGVGWAVADALPPSAGTMIRRSALSGFYLLDELVGFDRAIVVDAIKTGTHAPGTVLSFPFEALGTDASPSPHAVGLPSVLRLGRESGVPLPATLHIVAVEVDDMESISEGLTPAIRAAVPAAVQAVRSLLDRSPGTP